MSYINLASKSQYTKSQIDAMIMNINRTLQGLTNTDANFTSLFSSYVKTTDLNTLMLQWYPSVIYSKSQIDTKVASITTQISSCATKSELSNEVQRSDDKYLSKVDAAQTYITTTDANSTYMPRQIISDNYVSNYDLRANYYDIKYVENMLATKQEISAVSSASLNLETTFIRSTDAFSFFQSKEDMVYYATVASLSDVVRTATLGTYYQKADVDLLIAGITIIDSYTKGESDGKYLTMSNLSTYYDQSQIDAKIATINATLLTHNNNFSNYVLTNDLTSGYYTKNDADLRYLSITKATDDYALKSSLNSYALSTALNDYYTKQETDARIPVPIDAYTKTQSDDQFVVKNTLLSYYNQEQIDTKFNAYVLGTDLSITLNGYVPLTSGKIDKSYLPYSDLLEYKGMWNHTMTLTNGTGTTGQVYISSETTIYNFGAGNKQIYINDWIVYDGTKWDVNTGNDQVSSFNSRTGAIVPLVGDYSSFYADKSDYETYKSSSTSLISNVWSFVTPSSVISTGNGQGLTGLKLDSYYYTQSQINTKVSGLQTSINDCISRLSDSNILLLSYDVSVTNVMLGNSANNLINKRYADATYLSQGSQSLISYLATITDANIDASDYNLINKHYAYSKFVPLTGYTSIGQLRYASSVTNSIIGANALNIPSVDYCNTVYAKITDLSSYALSSTLTSSYSTNTTLATTYKSISSFNTDIASYANKGTINNFSQPQYFDNNLYTSVIYGKTGTTNRLHINAQSEAIYLLASNVIVGTAWANSGNLTVENSLSVTNVISLSGTPILDQHVPNITYLKNNYSTSATIGSTYKTISSFNTEIALYKTISSFNTDIAGYASKSVSNIFQGNNTFNNAVIMNGPLTVNANSIMSATASNSGLAITSQWSSYTETSLNGAEISNDVDTMKCLMLVGNRTADGINRVVSVWDILNVYGSCFVSGIVSCATVPTLSSHLVNLSYLQTNYAGLSTANIFSNLNTFSNSSNSTQDVLALRNHATTGSLDAIAIKSMYNESGKSNISWYRYNTNFTTTPVQFMKWTVQFNGASNQRNYLTLRSMNPWLEYDIMTIEHHATTQILHLNFTTSINLNGPTNISGILTAASDTYLNKTATNGGIKFSNTYSDYPTSSGTLYGSEISNNITAPNQALMIVGNKSAGGSRIVKVWDVLKAMGDFTVAGSSTLSGALTVTGNISNGNSGYQTTGAVVANGLFSNTYVKASTYLISNGGTVANEARLYGRFDTQLLCRWWSYPTGLVNAPPTSTAMFDRLQYESATTAIFSSQYVDIPRPVSGTGTNLFFAEFQGYINIDVTTDTTYYFSLSADNGGDIFIDGYLVASLYGSNALYSSSAPDPNATVNPITLNGGMHRILVRYYKHTTGTQGLFVFWKTTGSYAWLNTTMYHHKKIDAL